MAKEEKKEEPKAKGGKKKRFHLHEIRSTQAHDGTIVHHATYKEHKDSPFAMPERGPTATSTTPEEAGQHVAEQFGMNQMGAEPEEAGGEPQEGGGPSVGGEPGA